MSCTTFWCISLFHRFWLTRESSTDLAQINMWMPSSFLGAYTYCTRTSNLEEKLAIRPEEDSWEIIRDTHSAMHSIIVDVESLGYPGFGGSTFGCSSRVGCSWASSSSLPSSIEVSLPSSSECISTEPVVEFNGLQILLGSGEPDENISDNRSEYLWEILLGRAIWMPIVVVIILDQVKGRKYFETRSVE